MNVMVAGGAGYIGSHAVKQLIEAGHRVVVVDNLYPRAPPGRPSRAAFREIDLADTDGPGRRPREHAIDCVMHFAALAYVGESVTEPLAYYDNNTAGTVSLLQAMRGGRQAAGLQLHLRHLRRARDDAHRRDDAAAADQSLRLVEVVRRADPQGLRRGRSGVRASLPCATSTWPAPRPTARWARTTSPRPTYPRAPADGAGPAARR